MSKTTKTIIILAIAVLVIGIGFQLLFPNTFGSFRVTEPEQTNINEPSSQVQQLMDADTDVVVSDIIDDFAALEQEYDFETEFDADEFDIPDLDTELTAIAE